MKYVVYGKEACQSCKDTVALLEAKRVEYDYKSFGKDYDLGKFVEINKTHKTMPMITTVENGVESYVGGLHQLQQILGGSWLLYNTVK